MTTLDIKIYPDEVLRQKTELVTEFSKELHQFLDNMAETMYSANGVGLAAPQVGVLQRITVIDVSEEGNDLMEFINPQIIAREGKVPSEEGCLSIPDFRDKIFRAETVTVEAVNRHGEPFSVEADELLAICLQHEIDHLEGVLFIDHLTRLKKDMFKRKWKKRLLEAEASA
ncbi:MAG: peptide deformylase [Bdellovibrionales bacterium]|nr:peptide deformylase [Bdellovibrionales bacterium]